jgi:ATP/maltotriose-dependent transcriptional regulator MalT
VFRYGQFRSARTLTKREIEVLRLIAHDATNNEISADLQSSQHTVKSHVIHIFNKIGVNDRAQASAWGAINGLLLHRSGPTLL